MPNLIPAVTGYGHGGKRNDRPVLADELVARADDAGCVDYLQYFGNLGKRGSIRGFGYPFLALIDSVVDVERNPEAFRREDNQPSAGEVLNQSIGSGVCQWI